MILTPEEIEEFKGLFDMFDIDGGGSISVKELQTIMRQLGQNPTEQEVAAMMVDGDEDEDCEIDFIEFCHLMHREINGKDRGEELEKVFNIFCKDSSFITYNSLKEIFIELGADVSPEVCKMLITMHDADGNGKLDFAEFVQFLMAT